jgi:nucleoside-diphosphate-sugar epimerase
VELPPADFFANYVYVKDVVRAYVLAMQAAPTDHTIFNISGYAYRCNQVLDILREIYPNLVVNYSKSLNTSNPIDAYDLSMVRARDEIGYEPTYPLKEAVLDFVKTKQELGHQYEASQYDYDVVKRV